MNQKTAGIAVAVVGGVIGLLGLLADVIGLGASPDQFGSRQVILTVVGVVVIIIGVLVYLYGGRFFGQASEDDS